MSTQNEPAVEEQDEQQEDLRSVIERTYDALEADDEQEAVSKHRDTEPDDQGVVESESPAVEADGEREERAEAATQAVDDAVNQEIEEMGYPEHWDPQFRDDFDKMDPWAKKFLLDRHRSMESDYTKKTQDHADFLKAYQPVDEMMRAFAPALQQQGISSAELIRRWAAAESSLNADPAHAIKLLMNHYGVDIDSLTDSGYDHSGYEQNPEVQALRQQVNNLTNTISHNQLAANRSVIDQFAAQTTEAGTPAHPYFDDVIDDMLVLAQVDQSQGKAVDLKSLYDRACWMNTSIREQMTSASQQATAEANRQAAEEAAKRKAAEARQKAERAKQASKSVSGDRGHVTSGRAQHSSLRAAIEDAYNNAS